MEVWEVLVLVQALAFVLRGCERNRLSCESSSLVNIPRLIRTSPSMGGVFDKAPRRKKEHTIIEVIWHYI